MTDYLYTHIPPLSELTSKVTGNKQDNRQRNNTIQVTVRNRTTTASAATYETSTEPVPTIHHPKPPPTYSNPPVTTTATTSRQEQEKFQTEIDYEQLVSSLFDLSLIEYSPSRVVDRNNFVHFTPGKSRARDLECVQ